MSIHQYCQGPETVAEVAHGCGFLNTAVLLVTPGLPAYGKDGGSPAGQSCRVLRVVLGDPG